MKYFVVLWLLGVVSPSWALTCKNDYAGTAGCAANSTAAGDCETLGYALAEVEGCEHYLSCPFDSHYKRCASKSCAAQGFTQSDKSAWCGQIVTCDQDKSYSLCASSFENPCPTGYDSRLLSVQDCGSQGSNGWAYSSQTIPNKDGTGTITCGQCTPKTCLGYSAKYQSVENCGSASVTNKTGWKFTSCYAGDQLMGKCEAKTCQSYRYYLSSDTETGKYICKSVTTWLGDRETTSDCYDCAPCNTCTSCSGHDKRYIGNQSSISVCGYNPSPSAYLYGLYKNYAGIPDGRVKFSDNQGRTAKGCDVWLNIGASVANGADSLYCCKNGSLVSNSQCGL